jgi:hypothetical protein
MGLSELEKMIAAANAEAKQAAKIQQKAGAKSQERDARDIRWKEELARQKVEVGEGRINLGPVLDFYLHVKKEPREILLERYRKMMGVEPPPEVRHDWLAVNVGYRFQTSFYLANTGAVPPTVAMRENANWFTWPHGVFGRSHDADDPVDVEIWDDTYVVAAVKNPYAKGRARAAFQAVEMHGTEGVQFSPLVELLAGMLECATPTAQETAFEFFTVGVRDGLTRIRIAE